MNIGVIGCGSIGKKHIDNLSRIDDVQIFVHDSSKEVLESLNGNNVRVCKSIDSLFQRDNGLDAVWSRYFNESDLEDFIMKVKRWEELYQKPKDSYYIHTIAVFKQFRGQGIAGKLLEHIEKSVQKNGGSSLALEVISDNSPARRAYDKFGFKIINTVPITKLDKSFAEDEREIFFLFVFWFVPLNS